MTARFDALGRASYFYYDEEGNRTCSEDAATASSAKRSARDHTAYFTFDKDRRRESARTPLGELTYYTYDASANQTSVKDARGNHAYFYVDALNRAFCSEDAKQARSYCEYDRSGNRLSVKDTLSRTAYMEYDGSPLPVLSRLPT